MIPLLSIRDYRLDFDTFDGAYHVLDGIDIDLAEGETLGLVGETGCGKSVLACWPGRRRARSRAKLSSRAKTCSTATKPTGEPCAGCALR